MKSFYLFLLLVAPASSSLVQSNCHSGSDFGLELLNGSKARVYTAKINLLFSRKNVRIHTYPNTDAVKILVKDAIIISKGNLSINSERSSQRIDPIVYLQAKGFGKLKYHNNKTKLTECQIHLTSNGAESSGIPQDVGSELGQISNSCIGYQICSKIGNVKSRDYAFKKRHDGQNSFSKDISLSNSGNNDTKKSLELKSYINTIVDIVLNEVIHRLKEKHEDMIKIPDISQEFSFGTGIFETTGHFYATDGYFSDLTTLRRSTDAALEREGLKLSIACGFGLSKARIEYNDYELKFGIIKVDGTISGDIDGIFIDMKFSVDYNQQPCRAKLEYLKNTQLGRLDVQVTGLSPLNFLASYLATLIATKWEGDITSLIETKVSEVINYQMDHFDCEKYRPVTY